MEAHVIAGPASLRRLFAIDGVTGTQTIVVLESFFERPVDTRG
ncbi:MULTISPECIES: hypothetical protein [Amycolatopsis]|uniref:Uncharacterized protein n=1 Tax=Amycolatopsis bullii TaxID=941987 RepID=A0ABQ3KJK0_9PSEU|nr:hypothetical protein [Amycolatopsis bullii]GHG24666.1 hypothetical protein GCM10017567_49760 [Amycolatopsis bullii]